MLCIYFKLRKGFCLSAKKSRNALDSAVDGGCLMTFCNQILTVVSCCAHAEVFGRRVTATTIFKPLQKLSDIAFVFTKTCWSVLPISAFYKQNEC